MIVRGALGFCNWGIISLLDVRQFFSYSLGGKGISCNIIRENQALTTCAANSTQNYFLIARMKCREWISLRFLILFPFTLHFLILSPFPFHFLILSSFSLSPAARLPQVVQPCRRPDLKLQITNTEIQSLCVCKYGSATGHKCGQTLQVEWNVLHHLLFRHRNTQFFQSLLPTFCFEA